MQYRSCLTSFSSERRCSVCGEPCKRKAERIRPAYSVRKIAFVFSEQLPSDCMLPMLSMVVVRDGLGKVSRESRMRENLPSLPTVDWLKYPILNWTVLHHSPPVRIEIRIERRALLTSRRYTECRLRLPPFVRLSGALCTPLPARHELLVRQAALMPLAAAPVAPIPLFCLAWAWPVLVPEVTISTPGT